MLRVAVALAVLACLPQRAHAHPAVARQIADLSSRIAQSPRDAILYLRRGELHRIRADWDAAAADYRRARTIDPGLDIVDFHLGRMLLEAGRPDRALPSLDRFLAVHPDHPGALTARARARLRLGRNPEAAADFSRAIAQVRPPYLPDPDLYLERARALADSSPPRPDEAIRGLDEGMAALGPVVGLGLYAVELEVRLRRFDGALERLDRLASLSPRQEDYLIRRGAVLEEAGRPDEAREAYSRALESIASLPPEKRAAGAMRDRETRARAALERLTGLAAPAPVMRGGDS